MSAKDRDNSSNASPTLSVVICTRDRPELLARCLDSLTPALDPADDVLVVDNAPSSQATQRLVQSRPPNRPPIRYVLEPRPGLDIARNRGIRESKGALVVYCDDDVIVEASWLRRLKAASRAPKRPCQQAAAQSA